MSKRKGDSMIQKATHTDAATIAALAAKIWTASEKELTEEFEDMLLNGENAIFLYIVDDCAVGFAQCQFRRDYVEGTETSPVGYLEGVYVEAAYRRKGYARQLVQVCEDWVRSRGCTEFASDCELNNTDSLSFHLNYGFREANRIICFTKKI
jgi:aminoglycoside 6'-N-acetyltransferase I